jgi:plastocyanin
MVPGLRFSPMQITIHVGDSVHWQNADTMHHTATRSGMFDSGDLAPGGGFTHRFTTAGTFGYVCSYHASEGMTGTVTVEG